MFLYFKSYTWYFIQGQTSHTLYIYQNIRAKTEHMRIHSNQTIQLTIHHISQDRHCFFTICSCFFFINHSNTTEPDRKQTQPPSNAKKFQDVSLHKSNKAEKQKNNKQMFTCLLSNKKTDICLQELFIPIVKV